mmetsp:Transcript_6142/g.9679  ORF Transcript_6142/g.9679 Transcript_6142/m.9679 type:complete len:288 (-) Transcript_6142:39-902(-)
MNVNVHAVIRLLAYTTFLIFCLQDLQGTAENTNPNKVGDNDVPKVRDDTSVIITSNLIPTHPSVAMINETIHSLHHHMKGLPQNVPIFLSVDGLHKNDSGNQTSRDRLEEYIHRLKNTPFPFHNITVVPASSHLHIARTVKQAMDLVQTKFVYVVQHDLPFVRDVYHLELIHAMNDHPNTLRNVLFKLEGALGRFPVCPIYNNHGIFPKEEYQGLDFYATKRWSDNNHFTSKAYYQEMFSSIPHLNGAMEWGMMTPAKQNCSWWGQVVYGTRADNFLKHLDGRQSTY